MEEGDWLPNQYIITPLESLTQQYTNIIFLFFRKYKSLNLTVIRNHITILIYVNLGILL